MDCLSSIDVFIIPLKLNLLCAVPFCNDFFKVKCYKYQGYLDNLHALFELRRLLNVKKNKCERINFIPMNEIHRASITFFASDVVHISCQGGTDTKVHRLRYRNQYQWVISANYFFPCLGSHRLHSPKMIIQSGASEQVRLVRLKPDQYSAQLNNIFFKNTRFSKLF